MCVKLESALLIVSACAVPNVPLLAVKLDARGIVSSVPLPLPDFVPIVEPEKVIPNSWLKEY